MLLIRAELLRLMSRRFTVVAMIVALGLLGLLQIAVNNSYNAPQVAQIQVEPDPACSGVDPVPDECADDGVTFQPPTFTDGAKVSLVASSYVSALAMFLIASTFIGAEYASGSISNWLTFIPRRTPVFAAKTAVIAIVGAVFAAVCNFAALGVAVILARAHEVPLAGVGDGAELAARGVIPAVLLGVVGFSVALVTRHTAGAIGVLLGYLVIFIVKSTLQFSQIWLQKLTPWFPDSNLSVIVNKGVEYEVVTNAETYDSVTRQISLTHGLVYWILLAAVIVVVSGLVFRRRDLT